jgi:hypothetical protein
MTMRRLDDNEEATEKEGNLPKRRTGHIVRKIIGPNH